MGKEAAKTGPLARRPDNSAFMQQRLPAWSPMLTASTVLPFMYCMAALCLIVGVSLLITVQGTQEIKLDYTEAGTCINCFNLLQNVSNAGKTCSCQRMFSIEQEFKGDVFFYYGLQNFHQNLRKYMDSRDDAQMVGRKKYLKALIQWKLDGIFIIKQFSQGICTKPLGAGLCDIAFQKVGGFVAVNPSSYCEPYIRDEKGVPIAPCGAVANSMFNDSFVLQYHAAAGTRPVPMYRNGIAWYTDENVKFRNPQLLENQTLAQAFEGTAKPPYWQRPVYELDPDTPYNNGFINEDLIVWMREAAFPNFKKLYGILRRDSEPFLNGLPAGNYSIVVSYNYPVQYFKGRKQVVLSTVTWFGGQNRFLPIAYLVTSGLVLLIAVILTVIWWKFGRNAKNMKE